MTLHGKHLVRASENQSKFFTKNDIWTLRKHFVKDAQSKHNVSKLDEKKNTGFGVERRKDF
jgi:hypothetical protein|tara:strand:+ start:1648 stop:1830 length:183 start_codon:yes stop_codon:yes gene_type:complete